MKKQLIIPDDLVVRAKTQANFRNMNFTQYTIQALDTMVKADELLRAKPDIEKKIEELKQALQSLDLQ